MKRRRVYDDDDDDDQRQAQSGSRAGVYPQDQSGSYYQNPPPRLTKRPIPTDLAGKADALSSLLIRVNEQREKRGSKEST